VNPADGVISDDSQTLSDIKANIMPEPQLTLAEEESANISAVNRQLGDSYQFRVFEY